MPVKSRCFAPVRGKAMRATKVDGCGVPIYGDANSVTTEGFVSISLTANTDEGEEILVTNAAGNTCVRDTPCPKFLNYGVEIEFCNVDPYLFAMLTGQDVILDPATGDAIGFTVSTAADACAQGFALEAWTGAPGAACDTSGGAAPLGYILLPFVQGGVFGDFTIENGAISFTVTGAVTKDGSTWGAGPYAVEDNDVLSTPVTTKEHLRVMTTTTPPPLGYCGPLPVLDPSADAITSVTATPLLLEATFDAVPTAVDPWWVDFGDGEWDYSEDGSPIAHTYATAGTYTYTAYRGSSVFNGPVTVTAA
jgi:hypothetical protein